MISLRKRVRVQYNFWTIFLCVCFLASCTSRHIPVQPREPLFAILQNDRWGYIDQTGKVIIPPQFLNKNDVAYYPSHFRFSEGLAPMIAPNGLWGYIDKTGKFFIKPQ